MPVAVAQTFSGLVDYVFSLIVENEETGCWEWQGPRGGSNDKYGRVYFDCQGEYTHRLLYTWFVGSIPEDKELDHLCRNQICCRPEHLEVVTRKENVQRHFRLQTHCKNGHELSGDNLSRSAPRRTCRICLNEYSNLRYYARIGKVKRPPGPKTHCIHGHEWTPDNLIKNGHSVRCKICAHEGSRKAYRKRRARVQKYDGQLADQLVMEIMREQTERGKSDGGEIQPL